MAHLESKEAWKVFRIQDATIAKAKSGDEMFSHPIPGAKGARHKEHTQGSQVWWELLLAVLSSDTIQEEWAKSSQAHTSLKQKWCFHRSLLGLVCRAWIWGKQLAASLNAQSQHLVNMRSISFLLKIKTVAFTLQHELFFGKHCGNVRLSGSCIRQWHIQALLWWRGEHFR